MISISIIIATYNVERYLQKCLDSIIVQQNKGIEIIIIDGGSKDKTIEIVKANEKDVSFWQSEPDNGIYDAWNKGIAKARGEWIMFLGADDQLVPNAINIYTNFIILQADINNIDFISAKVQMIDNQGKLRRIKGSTFEWPLFLKKMTIAHPGSLHSKRLFEKFGSFDTNFKIVGDYEFLLRAGSSLRTLFLDKVIILMREDGVSDSIGALKEHYKAVTTTANYPKSIAIVDFFIAILKYSIKKGTRLIGINIYK